jgi:ATP-binding cassette subfamily B protein/subfamily B ATP-binding cassette protein MsbA
MNYFARALKDALRYWKTLALALLCSVGVASLWGANIAALFPIIEVTLHGESLQDWNRRRITQAETNIAKCEQQIAAASQQLAQAPPQERVKLSQQLDTLKSQKTIESAVVASGHKVQPLVDRYLPATPFATVMLIVAMIMFSTFMKQVLLLTNSVLVNYVSTSIARRIRMQIFNKALAMDRSGFMGVGTSGFTSHITHTSDMLSNGITNFYGGAVSEPLKILACLVGAWCLAWRLTIVSMLLAPLVALLVLWLNRSMKAVSRRMLDRSLGFHHVLLEAFGGMLTVQAYTMEAFERERFKKSTNEMRTASMLASFYSALANPITELLGLSMVSTALAVGAYLVINQETHVFGILITDRPISISTVMVFFGMLIGASDPVRKLSGVIAGINIGSVAASALYPMLDIQPRIMDPAQPQTVPSPHKCIELRNVSFSYDGQQFVLNDVNLTIPFGQRLAIVGPNGGGKSTLINLLCRFYDPQSGDVLMDGVPLSQMAIHDLRGRIALVTQQTELFNESILYNIRYGELEASEEQVIAAAKKAYAHDFIMSFPEGYETQVGPNGHRLSGGQRQRIALARAILRDPEILILDEATSQIDVESERLIQESLAAFTRGRTLIMITHRPSTLSLAEVVLHVDHGTFTPRLASSSHAA